MSETKEEGAALLGKAAIALSKAVSGDVERDKADPKARAAMQALMNAARIFAAEDLEAVSRDFGRLDVSAPMAAALQAGAMCLRIGAGERK